MDIRTALETEIIEGALAPGQKLDEAALAARFRASRTPVREALRTLAAGGLVTFQPRAGAIVAHPTVGEVIDLFELVAELEGVAARLACERMEPAHDEAIRAALDACRAAAGRSEPNGYYAANQTFHRAIHQASANRALVEEIVSVDKRLSPYRRFITLRPERTMAASDEHDAIADALAARNGERAATAMREHVRVLRDDALALARSLRI